MVKGNNNNKKENVLDSFVKRVGSIEYITAKDVQNSAIRIFRDIAFGNLDQRDIEKYSAFFLNANNIENLLVVAGRKKNEASIHCLAMEALFKNNPNLTSNQEAVMLHRRDYTVYTLYDMICQAFSALKVRGDIRILYGLPHQLAPMRRYFNNF